MSEKYKPKKGDRVRVVLEGEVNSSDSSLETGFNLQDEMFLTGIDVEAPFVVSIEKVEPPVVTFGPGDVVRLKGGATVRALGHSGYIRLDTGGLFIYGDCSTGAHDRDCFTSERFELVPL